ncbi:helix-turn-helix transcriptional regulator [Robiginitalea sp. SC105]|uniref:helix-turn-helix transcriptional regulator n=1 Tax=Robiginitalea sp. SC105 TaxID=2762332 RepID=UPI002107E6B4|nr:helix-turn-helix transcriptional regulator [Robiginitalea sp. SC105]
MQKNETWTDIYTRLSKAEPASLGPESHVDLALAAYLTGRDDESFGFMERAHRCYLESGQSKYAVRCCFWLGLMLMNNGEMARSNGWMTRGQRLMDTGAEQDQPERGLFIIPKALGSLANGHSEEARKLFEQAAVIGENFCDPDLLVLSHLGQGQALIQVGEVQSGIELLDESMVAINTDEIFPVVKGIVYCAVIETCSKVWDISRAQEWTAALTKWCNSQPDLVPFKGQCLARRGEIMQFQGDWHRALREIGDACKLLSRYRSAAAGEAFYRKAELHRLLGAYKDAEACYNESANWGRKPQPGLALLRLAQGDEQGAIRAVRTALKESGDPVQRMQLLPAVIQIMVAGGALEEAFGVLEELCEIANRTNVPFLQAKAAYSSGLVRYAEKNYTRSIEHSREAMKHLNRLYIPYHYARIRELKGQAYRELDDGENAALELSAAKWLFEQLKAKPDLERIAPMLRSARVHHTQGLTLRELQVLRLVASGKTNKSVARELFISERTVDRHVSNIFDKLGVSSRVSATVLAIKNKLIDAPV